MIEIKNVSKSYGKNLVLKNITLELEKGELVGILGANGSGKSTLLSILAGLQPPDSGFFNADGKDLLRNNKFRNQFLAYVPQENPLIEELNAWDNLRMWYSSEELKSELKNGILKLLGIDEFLKVPVSKMSGGMKKRLTIGCATKGGPSLMLLDEPTAALDLVCRNAIYDYFNQFKSTGGMMLIATHELQEIELCDRLFILKDGVLHPYTFDDDLPHLIGRL